MLKTRIKSNGETNKAQQFVNFVPLVANPRAKANTEVHGREKFHIAKASTTCYKYIDRHRWVQS